VKFYGKFIVCKVITTK